MVDVKSYLENPVRCLHCGSRNLVSEGAKCNGVGVVIDRVVCNVCGASWWDRYTLAGVVEDTPPRERL